MTDKVELTPLRIDNASDIDKIVRRGYTDHVKSILKDFVDYHYRHKLPLKIYLWRTEKPWGSRTRTIYEIKLLDKFDKEVYVGELE